MRSDLLICVLIVAAFLVLPAKSGSDNEKLDLIGYVESYNRMTIEGPSRFNYNETTLGMTLRAFPTARVLMLGSLQFEAIGIDERLDDDRMLDIYEQQDRAVVDPVRLELDEAYVKISGPGLKNLDLKMGKQRITWGTGDQFNPTDNLNPDDFHDPLQFGKKIPTFSMMAKYYLGPVTFTGVFLPLFEPSLLPVADIRPIFEKQFVSMASGFSIDTGDPMLDAVFDGMMGDALPQAKLGHVQVVSQLPDRTAANASAAFKVEGTMGSVDLSASYAYIRDDFGVPRRVTMAVEPYPRPGVILDEVDLHVLQKFPRLQVIGADFAANIPVIEIGFWGEAAYFIPEPFETEYFLDAGDRFNTLLSALANRDLEKGMVIGHDNPLENPYFKGVTGVDYTFPGAYYVNAQYIRGLPTDNTADLIDDYVFAGVDKPFLHDTIKPRIFSGMCLQDESWVLYPQIFFYPMDSVEFHLGAFLVFGEVDTKFGAFGDDLVFLRTKVSF